jgi:hypothetical protein
LKKMNQVSAIIQNPAHVEEPESDGDVDPADITPFISGNAQSLLFLLQRMRKQMERLWLMELKEDEERWRICITSLASYRRRYKRSTPLCREVSTPASHLWSPTLNCGTQS